MSELTRMTFNLTEEGAAALAKLPGRDRADAVNRALRLAAGMQRYLIDGRLTLLDDEGEVIHVHVA